MVKTKIYRGVTQGDWVWCSNCGAMMLLPYGADSCPECIGGDLQWVSDKEEEQEMTIDKLSERCKLEYVDRELEPQEYLTPDTIRSDYPKLYHQLTYGYMQCTDLRNVVRYLKRMMVDEMRKAIKAHGVEYLFSKINADKTVEDLDVCPIVACNPDDFDPEPRDVYIVKLYINEHDDVGIFALGKESLCEVKMEVMDIFLEDMDYIVGEIRATDEVYTTSEDSHITIDIRNGKCSINKL